ncbi:MAG TPA: division/cell wall cluster transcriptional repressor MraZ [Chloroflexota bacterium]|nr:division/cell wall cluster transcriptional repressor MraZ [Chloroflexota bacterium]
MLLGQYDRSLDEKSRLAIPAELRSALGSGAVLTRSFDPCLCIYPAARWEALAQASSDLEDLRPEARLAARALFSGAVTCEFDRQGRLVVPAYLREYADIHGDVTIAGVGNRVEIWNRRAWAEQLASFGAVAEDMRTLSISRA